MIPERVQAEAAALATIEELPDDCLLQVFRHLGVISRIRLEVVCQRWKALLQKTYRGVTKLDIAEFMNTQWCFYQQDNMLFEPTVLALLFRFGHQLKTLSFGARWLKVSPTIAQAVVQYCSKLSVLDLGCSILNADLSVALRQLAEQLVEFSLNEATWLSDEHCAKIAKLLPLMTNLRNLNLRRTPKLDYECLVQLPSELSVLNLNAARGLDLEPVKAFILGHRELTALYLSGFQALDDECLAEIAQQCHLRVLELSIIYREDLRLGQLVALKDTLKELNLQQNNSIDDESLKEICLYCTKLVSLNVIGCRRLRDYRALALCPSLSTLSFGHTLYLIDEDLEELSTLRTLQTLHCIRASEITDLGVSELRRCPALREISFTQCSNIGDMALLALAQSQTVISLSLQASAITDHGLTNLDILASKEKQPMEIDVSYCRMLSDAGITQLYEKLRDKATMEKPVTAIVHVHHTAITSNCADRVKDVLKLVM